MTASTTGRGFSGGSSSFSGGSRRASTWREETFPYPRATNRSSRREPDPELLGQRLEGRGLGHHLLQREVVAPQLALEVLAADLEGLELLRGVEIVADPGLRLVGDGEGQPVAARLVAGGGEDLDDVAVLELVAQRHHLAVHPGPDALVADLGVDGVGEVDGRRAAGQHLDLALRREAVHLLRVEVELQRLQELARVLDLLLPLEQLPQPGEGVVVLVDARCGPPCTSSARRCPPRRCGASRGCGSAPRTAARPPRSPRCGGTGSRWAAASR